MQSLICPTVGYYIQYFSIYFYKIEEMAKFKHNRKQIILKVLYEKMENVCRK